MPSYIFSVDLVDQLRRNAIHEVLRDLGVAGRDANLLNTPEFRKLLGYLTEVADGRDRREPMTAVPGTHRPQPRLRTLVNDAFGEYGDLTWFRLNKIANASRMQLTGQFPRMAASVGRLDGDNLADLVAALVSDAPDKRLLRMLNQRGGKVRNAGLELFTRLAYLFRPDLYFLIPNAWGEESGCTKFIGDDLRKYCALCRTLRTICDEVSFPAEIRGTLFNRAIEMDTVHPTLEAAINNSIGGALAWANVLEPAEGYIPNNGKEEIGMPLEWSTAAIRVRRGDTRLRSQLMRLFRNQCAITGACPRDLLEVAYIAPYPAGDVHSPRNAILLRSDLHTLWDVNLLGVHPDSLEIQLHPRLAGSMYESLAGTRLATPSTGSRIDTVAMRERWEYFEKSCRNAPVGEGKAEQQKTGAADSASPRTGRHAPEIEVLNELQPRRANPTGIWRAPAQGQGPAQPVVELEAEDA
ncbi:MAG: HNH endonuclease [Phycisphaerales bacterium]